MAKRPPFKMDYQDLERLYNGRRDDITKLDHPRRPWWKRLLIIAAVVIVAGSVLGWVGFYVFGKWQQGKTGTLELSVVVPDRAAAGDPLAFKIRLQNQTRDVIQQVHVRANYPTGFVWKDSTVAPEGDSHNTWSIASISPGQTKEITIDGALLGEANSLQTLFITATYNLPNFRSSLQAQASASVRLDPSHLSLTWDGPQQIPTAGQGSYTLHYTYNGQTSLPSSTIAIVFPTSFGVTSTTPALSSPQPLSWPLQNIAPGSTGQVAVVGQWDASASGDQTITATVSTPGTSGGTLSVATAIITTTVGSGDLSLNVSAKADSTGSFSLGSPIPWTLTFKNAGQKTMSDIEIRVRFDGDLIDWSKVALPNGGVVDGQTVVWVSATTPGIDKLTPGGSGSLSWSMPLVATVPSTAAVWTITATPTFLHHKLDGNAADGTYNAPSATVSVNTPITLTTQARYFADNGATLGQGPLPPQAKNTTTYQMSWKISDTIHPLTNVTVSADLPANVLAVSNSGSVTAGTIDLTDVHHPVWHLDRLDTALEPTAQILISLTPTASDIGRILVLTGSSRLTATDQTTNASVRSIGTTATTNLDTDPAAKGKGVVQP